MGKGSINSEQCNTPEEFSVQAKAALAAIPISSVNGMVESSSAHLCAVLALNGTVHAREAQTESLQRFVEESRELFTALSSGDQPRSYGEWTAQSLSLIRMLPLERQERTGMALAHWRRVV
jgi:hypothetical protein